MNGASVSGTIVCSGSSSHMSRHRERCVRWLTEPAPSIPPAHIPAERAAQDTGTCSSSKSSRIRVQSASSIATSGSAVTAYRSTRLANRVNAVRALVNLYRPVTVLKLVIPVCFGRFEFHAEWLRDEPCDATTTGQNKVPVSTLSWMAESRREHEIRSTQRRSGLHPHFSFLRSPPTEIQSAAIALLRSERA